MKVAGKAAGKVGSGVLRVLRVLGAHGARILLATKALVGADRSKESKDDDVDAGKLFR